jgi:hypothetical protein
VPQLLCEEFAGLALDRCLGMRSTSEEPIAIFDSMRARGRIDKNFFSTALRDRVRVRVGGT